MTPAPPKTSDDSSPDLPLDGGEAMLTMPCGKVRRCRRAEEGRDMVREAASRGGGGAADDAFVFDDVERLTLETEKKKNSTPTLPPTDRLPPCPDRRLRRPVRRHSKASAGNRDLYL